MRSLPLLQPRSRHACHSHATGSPLRLRTPKAEILPPRQQCASEAVAVQLRPATSPVQHPAVFNRPSRPAAVRQQCSTTSLAQRPCRIRLPVVWNYHIVAGTFNSDVDTQAVTQPMPVAMHTLAPRHHFIYVPPSVSAESLCPAT